ncbi:tetratricopeptide repeat protein 24 isoform X5 [Xiphophorus couchianus]|uniref:tetratricopeptide repeat protein 24 isoform X5 n=1 Tax=Xiphophorus couchianus TaxID=32473 RepID=UPI001016B7A5|nr:tetratricopeptide repeat protein 24 isoform X5 [Xiphophorus couchianus]
MSQKRTDPSGREKRKRKNRKSQDKDKPTCCRSNMASEESPPGEQVKRSSRRPQKKIGEVEDRTWAGHRALQAGRPQDALRCFKQALQAAAQLQDSRALRACSFNLGAAYVEAGRPGRGLDLLRRNRPGPKAERLPDLQFNTALAHNALGQYQEAVTHFQQAAQLYRSQGDGGSEGDTCMELGRCCSRTQVRTTSAPEQGIFPGIFQVFPGIFQVLFKVFLGIFQVFPGIFQVFFQVSSRCYSRCFSRCFVSCLLQDWPQAVQSFLRAAESYKMASMLDSAAAALKEAGSHMVQLDLSNHDDISSVLTECLSLSSSIRDPSILGELYLSVGVAYCRIRCFQEAVSCLGRAVEPAVHRPPLLAKVLHNLGAALNAVGDFSSAVERHRLAARLYGSQGCRGDQARCFSNLAIACSHLGDDQEAAESFILALQGFRDTGDRLAEVQVCEHLAECYLRQKKLQKAVELYKQALGALSHCKEAEGVQDRLVERLTAALQLSLTATQRPRPHRPRPHLPQPHSSPGHQDVRKLDVAQRLAANQHLDEQRVESPGKFYLYYFLYFVAMVTPDCAQEQKLRRAQVDRQRLIQRAESHLDDTSQNHQRSCSKVSHLDFTHLLHLSSRSTGAEDVSYLFVFPGELWLDRANPHTDSEASSPEQLESPPSCSGDLRKSGSPEASWRSRLCSLM